MKYEISYDVSNFLNASIDNVIHTFRDAFILVALVVFVMFLGDWRSTLIPDSCRSGLADRGILLHGIRTLRST